MQVVARVVALPDTAALPLTQDFAAELGGCSHISNVRVQCGSQVLGQSITGRLQRQDGVYMRGSGVQKVCTKKILELQDECQQKYFIGVIKVQIKHIA